MSMYVVSHKNIDLVLPKDYHIIVVGNTKNKILKKTFSDDTGDNISYKNSNIANLQHFIGYGKYS